MSDAPATAGYAAIELGDGNIARARNMAERSCEFVGAFSCIAFADF
jgi:hypothetical protein